MYKIYQTEMQQYILIQLDIRYYDNMIIVYFILPGWYVMCK